VIAQLGNLHLRARRILDGLYSGAHINRNRGSSKEFSQHRPYNPGDDPKSLDWKIFGRTDRLVVKQYEEETNMISLLLMDDSASMTFSAEGRLSKWEYAKSLAAAFTYLLLSQGDAVGVVSRETLLPPRSQWAHLDPCLRTLDAIKPGGVWTPDNILKKFPLPFRKKSFIVVFSDLMAEPDEMISTLRALHARKNEVMVFQILDPAERDLSFHGPVIFEDAETGEKIRTEPDVIRETYQKYLKARLNIFSQAFRGYGMDYVVLTTDAPFDKGLGMYLSWRGVSL